MNACACMGPQNGEPVCPCRMKTYYSPGAGMIALAERAARLRYQPPRNAQAWAKRLANDVKDATD